ncbi:MAG: hypothetical protein B7Z04_00465, partial [Rhodobacterales bacterium 32-66-9]
MQDQTVALEHGIEPVAAPARDDRAERPRRRLPRGRGGISLTVILTLVLITGAFGYLTLAYTGKTLRLPTWGVAEIEARLNDGLAQTRLPRNAGFSLGGVELGVDRNFVPRFRLRDIRLIGSNGRSLLTLPEAAVALDPAALLTGKVRPAQVRLAGARISIRRDAAGGIDLVLDDQAQATGPKSLSQVFAAAEELLASPVLASLTVIEAEGLTLSLTDDRAGRSWQVGDGRLVIENGTGAVSAELGLTLLDGADPAQAVLTLVADKASRTARLTAKVDNMAATDLAAMAP